jgi:hypothetical protein
VQALAHPNVSANTNANALVLDTLADEVFRSITADDAADEATITKRALEFTSIFCTWLQKRHVKCDEAKHMCNNCIRLSRVCIQRYETSIDPLSGQAEVPPTPTQEEGVAESIADARYVSNGTSETLEYRVQWQGFHESVSTWEPACNLGLNKLLADTQSGNLMYLLR